MLSEELKQRAFENLENLTVDELVERFKRLGSTRLEPGEKFNLEEFLDKEMERLTGRCKQVEGIKDCPFCGGKAEIVVCNILYERENKYIVRCNDCLTETTLCESREKAVEKWNRRVEGK